MSWSLIVQAIRGRVETLVAVPRDLQTFVDNEPLGDVAGATWCRISVQGADRFQASLGRKHFRTVGLVFLQLFTPLGTGDYALHQLIDAIDGAFLGVELDVSETPRVGIRFRAPLPQGPAEEDSETWLRQDVQIPFLADYFAGAVT